MSAGGNTVGTPRARELGAAFRKARLAKQLTLKQVADAMHRAESHPSRWENGKLVPSAEDLGALMQILDITFIPGLLQTEEYAYNITIAAGFSPEAARSGALTRINRQTVLDRRRPPKYVAAIGEQALRYPPCSADVMYWQLRHLLDMGQRENITIVVIPMAVGYYSPAMVGPFVIFEIPDGKEMIYIESFSSSTILTNSRSINGYRDAATTTVRTSLGVDNSVTLIEEIMGVMGSEL